MTFITRAILEEAFTNPVSLVRKKLMIFVVYDEKNYSKEELGSNVLHNDNLMYYVPQIDTSQFWQIESDFTTP